MKRKHIIAGETISRIRQTGCRAARTYRDSRPFRTIENVLSVTDVTSHCTLFAHFLGSQSFCAQIFLRPEVKNG